MADYIYLLEGRLSQAQRNALIAVRGVAREKGLTIFLVGGAVRDLTSGSPVRDLDVVIQGNALKLKKDIEKAGGVLVGESDPGQALFVQLPGGVRMEIGSTLAVSYPKPGKPVARPSTILDDLRRRDFTANAMALSLNEGSYGLLMDPLNGVADIENRELRLVSNYGFIEDPIRMVRAARLMARLGWQMDEKTAARYETGKQEGYISSASKFQLGYETEEIVHEEDPLRVLKRLEAEGWLKVLAPSWGSAKVNVSELERLRENQTLLQMQGIHPNSAAANFPILTAKLTAKEIAELKQSFARPGFVREIEALDGEAKDLLAQLSAKTASQPSQAWKLLHSAKPEAVLLVAHSSKSPAIQAKFKSFYTEWPLAKQKIPYVLMQEMRITPDLPGYEELLESLVFEAMDGKLETVEEMKAFLEPFSPPAPPPPVSLRRPRAPKKDAKSGKGRAKKATAEPVFEGDVQAGSDPLAPEAPSAAVVPEPVAKAAKPAATKVTSPPVFEKSEPISTATKKAATPAKATAVKAVLVAHKAGSSPVPVAKKTVLKAPNVVKKTVAAKSVPTKAIATKASAPRPVVKKASAGKKVVQSIAKPVAKKAAVKVAAKKAVAKKVVAKKAVAKKAVKTSAKKSASKTAGAVVKKTPGNAVKKAAVKAKTAAKPPAKKLTKGANKNRR